MHADGMHALVGRAKTGDPQAWHQLHALVQPYLLGLAQRRLGPHWPERSVSDLVQEVWVRVVQGLSTFQGGDNDANTGALFRAWLAQTMRHIYLNDLRFDEAQRRKPPRGTVRVHLGSDGDSTGSGGRVDPPGQDHTPSTGLRAEEQRGRIEQALACLSDPLDVEIVRLHFFENLSLTGIAKRLSVSLDRVRKGFHRSLKRLKPKLEELQ